MKKNNGHKSHGILMLLCCLGPLVLLALFSSFNLQLPGIKNILTILLVLACPLGHILMMKFMHNGHEHENHENRGEGKIPQVQEGQVVIEGKNHG